MLSTIPATQIAPAVPLSPPLDPFHSIARISAALADVARKLQDPANWVFGEWVPFFYLLGESNVDFGQPVEPSRLKVPFHQALVSALIESGVSPVVIEVGNTPALAVSLEAASRLPDFAPKVIAHPSLALYREVPHPAQRPRREVVSSESTAVARPPDQSTRDELASDAPATLPPPPPQSGTTSAATKPSPALRHARDDVPSAQAEDVRVPDASAKVGSVKIPGTLGANQRVPMGASQDPTPSPDKAYLLKIIDAFRRSGRPCFSTTDLAAWVIGAVGIPMPPALQAAVTLGCEQGTLRREGDKIFLVEAPTRTSRP